MQAGDNKKISSTFLPLSSICLSFSCWQLEMAGAPRASFPLLPTSCRIQQGLQEERWVPGHSDGLATRSSECPQSNKPDEPHRGLQAWQKPWDEASQGRNALLPNGEVRSSARPYTLLLPLFSPFQSEGHPAHPTSPSPSHLLYWLWSHQMPPWAKQLINMTHATHSCSSKNVKPSHLFQQQPKPPSHPCNLPCLRPSAPSAHSSSTKLSLCRWGLSPADPMLGPSTGPKPPNTAVGVGIPHLLMN